MHCCVRHCVVVIMVAGGGKEIGIVTILHMLALSTARSMCSGDIAMESWGLHC